jgi:hypothetical protein
MLFVVLVQSGKAEVAASLVVVICPAAAIVAEEQSPSEAVEVEATAEEATAVAEAMVAAAMVAEGLPDTDDRRTSHDEPKGCSHEHPLFHFSIFIIFLFCP